MTLLKQCGGLENAVVGQFLLTSCAYSDAALQPQKLQLPGWMSLKTWDLWGGTWWCTKIAKYWKMGRWNLVQGKSPMQKGQSPALPPNRLRLTFITKKKGGKAGEMVILAKWLTHNWMRYLLHTKDGILTSASATRTALPQCGSFCMRSTEEAFIYRRSS